MIGAEEQDGGLAAAMERQERALRGVSSFLAMVRGPEHIFEFANEAYLRIIQHRPCLGRRFQDVLPESESDGILGILNTVYETGVVHRGKGFRSELGTGIEGEFQEVVVDFQFQPLRGEDGAVTGVYIEGADVTERTRDVAALERLKLETDRRWAELEAIYQSAPVGLALLGAERLDFRKVNRVQASFYELPPEQLIGRTIRETTPDVDGAEALLFRVAAGEEIRDIELVGELPQRPGERRSWMVSYSPMRLPDGRVDAIICTAIETTELRQAERLAQQNEKLAAVGRLAASIAHEINNPLEAVTNLLYLAKTGDSLAQAREFIEVAESELRRVSAITTQTLRFQRQINEPACVTCDDLLSSALSIYQGRLTSAGVPVLKRKRAHKPVVCFDGEIRQVLNNLVGNASDALTAKGGRLYLRSREGTDWQTGRPGLWVTVADTGCGMSEETKRKAFEAFYSTKGMNGTGLGLWISQEIVSRHQGRMLVRSSQAPGRSGTVMSLFLPFTAARR